MKCGYGMILLLVLPACGLFKNTAKQVDKERMKDEREEQLEAKLERSNKENSLKVLNYRDSTRSDYLITLWPKGVFTWDAEGGFTGEAEKVLISGTQKQEREGSELESKTKDEKEQGQLKYANSTTLSEERKHKEGSSKVSWKTTLPLLVLVLVVVGIIIWFIIQKLRR